MTASEVDLKTITSWAGGSRSYPHRAGPVLSGIQPPENPGARRIRRRRRCRPIGRARCEAFPDWRTTPLSRRAEIMFSPA